MTAQRPEGLLPDLYGAADAAAQAVQRWHLRVVKSELWLLVIGTLLALLSSGGLLPLQASLLAALVLVVSSIVSLVGRAKKFERQWFDCRAIAESAKTMAWRYMTRAEPYRVDKAASEIDALFAKELTAVSRARPDVAGVVAQYTAGGAQITTKCDACVGCRWMTVGRCTWKSGSVTSGTGTEARRRGTPSETHGGSS